MKGSEFENMKYENDNQVELLLGKYKEFSTELNKVVSYYNKDEIVNQNRELMTELESLRTTLEEMKVSLRQLTEENIKVKTALSEQILNEKMSILKISKKRIENYFDTKTNDNLKTLSFMEKELNSKIDGLLKDTLTLMDKDYTEVMSEILNLQIKLKGKIQHTSSMFSTGRDELRTQISESYQQMKPETVTEEEIQKRCRNNNIEIKFGLNWLTWIGVFLIMLAFVTFGQYSYANWLNDVGRGIFLFVTSLIVVGLGEVLHRKRFGIFANGITSLGIGGFYIACFMSYFVLNIFSASVTIGIAVILSFLSVYITRRYNSKTVAILTLVGGYLPVVFYHFLVKPDIIPSVLMIVYVLLLNSAIILTSVYKEWNTVKYASFFLGMFVFLVTHNISDNVLVNIGYAFAVFFMFSFINLAYPVIHKSHKLQAMNVVIQGLNALWTCSIAYKLLHLSHLTDYKGFLSIGYAVIFLLLAYALKKRKGDRDAVWFFSVTSLVYLALFVPFQFGWAWGVIGWVLQSIVIITYGTKTEKRPIEYYGWILYLITFLNFRVDALFRLNREMYHFNYLAIVGGICYLLFLYFKVKKINDYRFTWRFSFLHVFKYIAFIELFRFCIDESNYIFWKYFSDIHNSNYIYSLLLVSVVGMYFWGLSKMKCLMDVFVSWVTTIGLMLFSVGVLLVNSAFYVFPDNTGNLTTEILYFAILIAFTVLASINFFRVSLYLILLGKFNLEWHPIIFGSYALAVSVLMVEKQFQWFDYSNFVTNLVLMIYAFMFISFGFKKKYIYIRRVGLFTSMFVCLKLFFIDLNYLNALWRIISFFVIGLIMLTISFVYHKISIAMETDSQKQTNKMNSKQ